MSQDVVPAEIRGQGGSFDTFVDQVIGSFTSRFSYDIHLDGTSTSLSDPPGKSRVDRLFTRDNVALVDLFHIGHLNLSSRRDFGRAADVD